MAHDWGSLICITTASRPQSWQELAKALQSSFPGSSWHPVTPTFHLCLSDTSFLSGWHTPWPSTKWPSRKIYLPSPVFSHGQLYVAFSRARSLGSVKVQVVDTQQQGKRGGRTVTPNVDTFLDFCSFTNTQSSFGSNIEEEADFEGEDEEELLGNNFLRIFLWDFDGFLTSAHTDKTLEASVDWIYEINS